MTPFPIGARVRDRELGLTGEIVTVIRKGALNPITGYRIRFDAGDYGYRLHGELIQCIPIRSAVAAIEPVGPRRVGGLLVFDGGRA